MAQHHVNYTRALSECHIQLNSSRDGTLPSPGQPIPKSNHFCEENLPDVQPAEIVRLCPLHQYWVVPSPESSNSCCHSHMIPLPTKKTHLLRDLSSSTFFQDLGAFKLVIHNSNILCAHTRPSKGLMSSLLPPAPLGCRGAAPARPKAPKPRRGLTWAGRAWTRSKALAQSTARPGQDGGGGRRRRARGTARPPARPYGGPALRPHTETRGIQQCSAVTAPSLQQQTKQL